jgi:hypothetical protein
VRVRGGLWKCYFEIPREIASHALGMLEIHLRIPKRRIQLWLDDSDAIRMRGSRRLTILAEYLWHALIYTERSTISGKLQSKPFKISTVLVANYPASYATFTFLWRNRTFKCPPKTCMRSTVDR